jgi:membrane protein DedA with SNARE-associated domain/membrane-associated phospholipid phosphatase
MGLKLLQEKLIHLFEQIPIKYMHSVGYIFVFLAAVLEGIPFIGNFLPGQTIVILAGFLAYQKLMNFWVIVLLASTGVILGDLISFKIGKKYGESFLKKHGKYFLLNKERYAETKKLLKAHLGKTLFFGKFNNFTRSGASFITGSLNLSFGKFMFWNVISGLTWGALYVSVGYFAGRSFEFVVKYIGFGVIAATIIVFVLSILYKRFQREQIFSKYYLHLFIAAAIALVLFSRIIDSLVESEPIRFDIWISNNVQFIQNNFLTGFMQAISFLGGWIIVGSISALVVYYLIRTKDKFSAWFLVAVLISGELIVFAIKNFIHRARPENQLAHVSSFSFPSGHATIAVILTLALFFLLKDKQYLSGYKYVFYSGLIIYALLMGISRVYLNVHWASDVLGGWLLGLFIVIIAMLIKRYLEIMKTITTDK